MLLVLLQVKLLVVFAWADYRDPLRQQLRTTGNSFDRHRAGRDWAAVCKQLASNDGNHKCAEVGHTTEALVAAKALGCPIQSDVLAVMLPMLEQSDQFYGGTFQHLTEQHKGMWRTILADGQISPGMSLEAVPVDLLQLSCLQAHVQSCLRHWAQRGKCQCRICIRSFPRNSGIAALPCVELFPFCISHVLRLSVTLRHFLSVSPKAEYFIAAFEMTCGMLFQTFAMYSCNATSCSCESGIQTWPGQLCCYAGESIKAIFAPSKPAVVAAESDTAV